MVWDMLRQGLEYLATQRILPQPFFFGFISNAVICMLLLGPLLGLLGTLVVMKRMAFFSQAIGNGALTGVSIGVLIGESANAPYISMFSFCLCFGLLLKFTQLRSQLSNDVVIGVFLSISLALGASLLLFVSAQLNTHVLESILFGSVLTVNDTDMNILIVVAAISLIVLLPLFNRMLMATFSPVLAGVRGANARLLDYVFVAIITIVTVACVKIVGAVLVEALLLIPAAAARNISRTQSAFVGWSVVFATVSGVVGVLVPAQWELAVPSGGAIVLCAAVIFVLTFVLARFRNLGARA